MPKTAEKTIQSGEARVGVSDVGRLARNAFRDVRDFAVKPLLNPLRVLGGNIMFGLGGVPMPTGYASVENWISDRPDKCGRFVSFADARVMKLPPAPTLGHEQAGDQTPPSATGFEVTVPREFVAEVPEGRIAERVGSVISSDNLLLCDLPLASPATKTELKSLLNSASSEADAKQIGSALRIRVMNRGALPKPVRVEGSIAVATTRQHTNYYHWLVDAFPRLRHAEAGGLNAEKYYVPMSAGYHRETLSLAGIDEERLVPAQRRQHVSAHTVVFAAESPGIATPGICEFLRAKLLEPALARSASTGKRRLLITRQKASWRRVVNEDEVLAFLAKRGFESVDPGSFSLADQIRMLHEAEIVIGAHGAGLTNTIFCEPGTKVMEFSVPSRQTRHFHAIASCRGLRYLNLVCEQGGPQTRTKDSDIRVDLSLLAQALDALEEASPLSLEGAQRASLSRA